MTNSALSSTAPTEETRTVATSLFEGEVARAAPTRRRNVELRSREHLTANEVEALIEAAKANRYGHRDATTILVAFRHGLRAAEVCDLRWDQVDFNGAVLHVRRVKNGTASTHPLLGDELRALRRLQGHRKGRGFALPNCPAATTRNVPLLSALDWCVGLFAADRPHAAPAFRGWLQRGPGRL